MGGAASFHAAQEDDLGVPPPSSTVPQLGRAELSMDDTSVGVASIQQSHSFRGQKLVGRQRRRRSTVAALNLWSTIRGKNGGNGGDAVASAASTSDAGSPLHRLRALRASEEAEVKEALKFLGDQHAAAILHQGQMQRRTSRSRGASPTPGTTSGLDDAVTQAAETQTKGLEQVMNLIARLSQPAPSLREAGGGSTCASDYHSEVQKWNDHLRSLFSTVTAEKMGGDSRSAHSVQSYLVRQFVSDEDRMDLNEAVGRETGRTRRHSGVDEQSMLRYSMSGGGGDGGGGGGGDGGVGAAVPVFLSRTKEGRRNFSNSFVHKKRSYGRNITESLEQRFREMQLALLSDWSFDTNELNKLTEGKAITFMGHTLLQQHDLLDSKEINLQPDTLDRFLARIEEAYKPNPYHNAVHGADCAQTLNSFFRAGLVHAAEMDTIDIFAAVLSALCHDVGHPGVNADWLKATDDPLALTYNDVSPLENMHVSLTFRIAKSGDDVNVFKGLSKPDYAAARHLMVNMVLGTDMANHFSDQLDYRRKIVDADGTEELTASKRTSMLRMALHISDISNIAKSRDISQVWTERLMHEFFAQGDRERDAGRAVSPMCDRNSTDVSKSQVGFIDVIVRPSFALWFQTPGVTQDCVTMSDDVMGLLDANKRYWIEEGKKVKAPDPAADSSSKRRPSRQPQLVPLQESDTEGGTGADASAELRGVDSGGS